MTTTDVLVAGAGVGGCAAALAHAQLGRRVLLVGLQGSPDKGLSGEWLHPAGVAALQQLGIVPRGPDFVENSGFVVHPGPGSTPVTLPYAQGTAVSMPHHTLVDLLRQAAGDHPGITVRLGERVTAVSEDGRADTTAETARADVVVGAEGRASLIRRTLRPQEPAAGSLSNAAGFELTGHQLPTEGYGHIFLGGPGPMLMYRISADTIRLALDVPPRAARPGEMVDLFRRHYAPALPSPLRNAFIATLAQSPRARWAANRFRRREFYGRGRCALVGDAVGFTHPLAALGMTMAVTDAECLARHGDLAAYARERRATSWAPERVSVALHRALTGTDAASEILRDALFDLWRTNTAERDRMMRLLAVQDDTRRGFALAVARIVTGALARTGTLAQHHPTGRPALSRRVRDSMDLAAWVYWLCSPSTGIPPAHARPHPPPSARSSPSAVAAPDNTLTLPARTWR